MFSNPIGTISDYRYVALFMVLGIAFIAFVLIFAWFIRRRGLLSEEAIKLSTYECGEAPVGQAWSQFHVGYYIIALLFVVFDIETVFLAPWALVLRNLDPSLKMFAFFEMLVFLAVLTVGLVYAWKKGVLKWI